MKNTRCQVSGACGSKGKSLGFVWGAQPGRLNQSGIWPDSISPPMVPSTTCEKMDWAKCLLCLLPCATLLLTPCTVCMAERVEGTGQQHRRAQSDQIPTLTVCLNLLLVEFIGWFQPDCKPLRESFLGLQ